MRSFVLLIQFIEYPYIPTNTGTERLRLHLYTVYIRKNIIQWMKLLIHSKQGTEYLHVGHTILIYS
jgi:hypothetical protein